VQPTTDLKLQNIKSNPFRSKCAKIPIEDENPPKSQVPKEST
jgi:hypothetical protein